VLQPQEWQHLLRGVLYYDRINWPVFKAFAVDGTGVPSITHRGVNPAIELLTGEGLLEQPTLPQMDATSATRAAMWEFQERVFLTLEDVQPGCWTLATPGHEFVSPLATTPQRDCLYYTLVNALPAPTLHSDMRKILDFRRAHSQQLLDLRSHLDELDATILQRPASELACRATLQRLDNSLAAVWKEIDRNQAVRFIPSSLTTVFDIGDGAVKGVGVATLASTLFNTTMSATTTAVGAAVGSAIAVLKAVMRQAPSPKGVEGPFAYLYSATEQGIIHRPS
jgi:hypothetical protein